MNSFVCIPKTSNKSTLKDFYVNVIFSFLEEIQLRAVTFSSSVQGATLGEFDSKESNNNFGTYGRKITYAINCNLMMMYGYTVSYGMLCDCENVN